MFHIQVIKSDSFKIKITLEIIMIEELEYKGDIEGKNCAICKLNLRKDDSIVSCLTCQSLFHENHFLEWLELNSKCPVCERDYSEIIAKYSIKQEYSHKPIETYRTNFEYREDFTIQNPERTSTKKFKFVYGIIFGIVFSSLAVVMCNLLAPLPFAFIFTIFGLLFFIAGIFVVKQSIQSYKDYQSNPWSEIILNERSIKIINNDQQSIELFPEDIYSIILDTSSFKPEDRRRQYKLSLEFELAKKENLRFGEIYGSFNQSERDNTYNYLNQMIRTRYKIETIQSKKGVGLWFKSNKITLILSIVGYIVISAITLTINHLFINFW